MTILSEPKDISSKEEFVLLGKLKNLCLPLQMSQNKYIKIFNLNYD